MRKELGNYVKYILSYPIYEFILNIQFLGKVKKIIIYLGTPILETERLILRSLKMTDAQKIFNNWLSDERVSVNIVSAAHKSVSETIRELEEIV